MLQDEAPATQAGVAVQHVQERLVLDALMRNQPADLQQLQGDSLETCEDIAEWGDGLRTEWVTQCSCSIQGVISEIPVSHRLYMQTASGEMRLATTMITQV